MVILMEIKRGVVMEYLIISKELLSEVLNYEVDIFLGINKNEIDYTCCRDENEGYIDISINIYEFAFKCKEWILNQKNKDCFYIADQFSLNIESQMGVIKYYWCVLLKNNSRVSPEFKADSETEAIIKACTWIMENSK